MTNCGKPAPEGNWRPKPDGRTHTRQRPLIGQCVSTNTFRDSTPSRLRGLTFVRHYRVLAIPDQVWRQRIAVAWLNVALPHVVAVLGRRHGRHFQRAVARQLQPRRVEPVAAPLALGVLAPVHGLRKGARAGPLVHAYVRHALEPLCGHSCGLHGAPPVQTQHDCQRHFPRDRYFVYRRPHVILSGYRSEFRLPAVGAQRRGIQ